jgi:hypothetical protein
VVVVICHELRSFSVILATIAGRIIVLSSNPSEK